MSEGATFDESDWRDLTPANKKAIRTITRYAVDFEVIAKCLASVSRAWMR